MSDDDEVKALVASKRIAKDYVSARPGEAVVVDSKGRYVTPTRDRRARTIGALLGAAIGGALAIVGMWVGGMGAVAGLFSNCGGSPLFE